MKSLSRVVPYLLFPAVVLFSCAPKPAVVPAGQQPGVAPAPRTYSYAPDPYPERVKTLVFTTIAPEFLADSAGYFARNGIDGFMVADIMHSWDSDIWKQPTTFTPDEPAGRVVGEGNPLFQLCKRMNEQCRAAGMNSNSIKVAFYRPLPDWFDDAAWDSLCENFRQCAIFARDAGFAGVALDIEYVYPTYELTYEAYLREGYPRDRLPDQAHQRGYEIMSAMISEFPDMVNWHLPETVWTYGPLGVQLFAGMVDALAEVDAPGGIHMCVENMYDVTDPERILNNTLSIDLAVRKALNQSRDKRAFEYWMRRGSIATGMWPLGYYRMVMDASGRFMGYSGKTETFGDRIVGSYADKSANFPPEEFRRQYAAVRQISREYAWIYGHGPVLWQMSETARRRYHAAYNDTLPTDVNLEAYLAVLREKPVITDSAFATRAELVRNRFPVVFPGTPPRLWHIGPFPCRKNEFSVVYPPERGVDLAAMYSAYDGYDVPGGDLRWKRVDLDATGFVDLKEIVSGQDSVLAYSVAWVDVPTLTRAELRVGSNDYVAVFVNGREVLRSTRGRVALRDENVIPVQLTPGWSEIMVKCGNVRRAWGFYLRVTDENGNEVPGLRWVEP
ncbi:MAG TPA: hypothetical protein P5179_00105 [Candidatus Latescibacteria bacterium]|nr:hypothetical protein [Candidatus Latescibacterota bacterium]